MSDAPKMKGGLPDAEFSVFVQVDPSGQPLGENESSKDHVAPGPGLDPAILGRVEALASHKSWMSRRGDRV